jgi:hypothetical protein
MAQNFACDNQAMSLTCKPIVASIPMIARTSLAGLKCSGLQDISFKDGKLLIIPQ